MLIWNKDKKYEGCMICSIKGKVMTHDCLDSDVIAKRIELGAREQGIDLSIDYVEFEYINIEKEVKE